MKIARRTLLSVLSFTTAGCSFQSRSEPGDRLADEDWRTAGYDRYNRGTIPDATLTDEIAEVWSTDVGRGPWVSPTVSDDTVYVANRSALRAYSIDDGNETKVLFDEKVSGTPVVDERSLLVPVVDEGSGEATLHSLEATDDSHWKTRLSHSRPFSPTSDVEAVAVRTSSKTWLLSRSNGEVRWSVEETAYEGVGRHRFADLSPVLSDAHVYVPCPDGVRCRDRETGDERWHSKIGEIGASPVLADGVLYVSTVDDGIISLDADSGEKRWVFEASGCWTSPAVDEKTAYVTAGSDAYALSLEDGDVQWHYDGHGLRGDSYSDPISVGDAVVFGSIGRGLTILSSDEGTERFHFDGDGTDVSHAIGNGTIFVLDGRTLRAFREE